MVTHGNVWSFTFFTVPMSFRLAQRILSQRQGTPLRSLKKAADPKRTRCVTLLSTFSEWFFLVVLCRWQLIHVIMLPLRRNRLHAHASVLA